MTLRVMVLLFIMFLAGFAGCSASGPSDEMASAQVKEFLEGFEIPDIMRSIPLAEIVEVQSVSVVDRLKQPDGHYVVQCAVEYVPLKYETMTPRGRTKRIVSEKARKWLDAGPQFVFQRYESGWRLTGAI